MQKVEKRTELQTSSMFHSSSACIAATCQLFLTSSYHGKVTCSSAQFAAGARYKQHGCHELEGVRVVLTVQVPNRVDCSLICCDTGKVIVQETVHGRNTSHNTYRRRHMLNRSATTQQIRLADLVVHAAHRCRIQIARLHLPRPDNKRTRSK